jgi:uncharacterized repeat protein (TIGR01451 family)
MHKFIQTICLFVLLTFALNTQAQIINIPDANFKAKLLQSTATNSIALDSLGRSIKVDINNNDEISVNEALRVFQLDISSSSISNLTGLENFVKLTTLCCYNNSITNIPQANLINLKKLVCYLNNFTSFNLSLSTNLEYLNITRCALTSFTANSSNKIRYLDMSSNLLTSLDVHATTLDTLICTSNNLNSLDVTGCINMKMLSCYNNSIDSLDLSSCINLQSLGCSDNELVFLNVSGNINLIYLFCENNDLTSLNVSNLSKLQSLSCNNNNLTSLNANGCRSLKYLHCRNSRSLSSLGFTGCDSLEFLYAAENSLTNLDVSSCINLKYLECPRNQLSDLNLSNNIKLETLDCYDNMFDSLNVSGLSKLKSLFCYNNKLLGLRVSGCTSLESFSCENNFLKNLSLVGLINLQRLSCYNNQLEQLTLGTSHPLLHTIECGSNALTNLNLAGCRNLATLNANFNQLTGIDLTSCTQMQNLGLYENKLQFIYLKNGVNQTRPIELNWNFGSFIQTLRYICADTSEFAVLQRFMDNFGYTNVAINSLCDGTLNGSLYTLQGNVKYDSNNNNCSSTSVIYPVIKINVMNSTDSADIISDAQGNFSLFLNSDTFTLKPVIPTSYFYSIPASAVVVLPDSVLPSFCIKPNGVHNDLSVTVIPVRPARPGFSDATYKIVLKNKGTQIESGTIIFNYDESRQDYISSTDTPSNIQSGQLTFTFSDLQLFETREITVTMRTNAPTDNPAVNVGDVIQLSVTANLDNGVRDEFFKDNFQNIRQTVVGSFDPNDKTCLEGDIITPALVGDFVNYLIRFENTGTANAENVVVTDFIDLNTFDISTLEITSTSHNCKTLISNGNKVQFVFDNINLPFTEPLKHGYVAFKLKLKNNLGIGDSLKNKADIYFDYNLPITTNTAASRIDNVTAIKTIANKEGSLSVYPNPSNGNFTVNFESPVRQTIIVKIVAINGNVVYEQNLYHNYQSQLQLNQNLPAGVYLITVNSEKEQYTQKLIITK